MTREGGANVETFEDKSEGRSRFIVLKPCSQNI